MDSIKRIVSGTAVVAGAAAAALYVLAVRTRRGVLPANDVYAYFYPKALYALASLRDGGHGLLWNPFQNCGQPFFALSQTGLLYPPYLLFLLFEPALALQAVLALQLLIGGVGAYLLCRELGTRPLAAAAGGLAFEVGNSMVVLSTSSPTHSAPFAWLPLIALCFARLVRDPSPRRAGLLALVLAIALLPGMPQTVFFAYQLLVLWLLYELATRRSARRVRLLVLVGVALLLPPLLAAVQLLPELANVQVSVRNVALSANDANPGGPWNLRVLRRQLQPRLTGQPFVLVPCMLALTGLLARSTRRWTMFFAGAAALYVGLAFGSGTPLYELYSRLPGGSSFRQPSRFLWMTSFCLAPLTALGVEALSSSAAPRRGGAAWALVLTALPLLALWWLTPNGLRPIEWIAALCLCAVSVAAALSAARASTWVPIALLGILALQLIFGPFASSVRLFAAAPDMSAVREVVSRLRGQLTDQDRVHLIPQTPGRDFGFVQKSASIERIPAVFDYEPLTSRRYAEFFVRMRAGRQMRTLSDYNFAGAEMEGGFNRRLFDLTAARYIIAVPGNRAALEAVRPPLQPVDTPGPLLVFENPQRLPRAYYVPQVAVVMDSRALLERLASDGDDLRATALLESPPASGFLGEAGPADAADVGFTRDDPEDVELAVVAPRRGFVVLSDQLLPGWTATVNGEVVPIERANYAFRLVEVPPGRSIVRFHYAPSSLRWGALLSACAGLLLAALLLAPTGPKALALRRRLPIWLGDRRDVRVREQ